jgi:ectoine hydroxylase-related dioxygenase (phytanoyl-CoA dioxygenase family)
MTEQSAWLVDADYDIDAFRQLVSRTTEPGQVPHAVDIQRNLPIYDGAQLSAINRDPAARRALLGEMAWTLGQGPGALAIKGGLDQEHNRLDDATDVYQTIIAEQHAAGRAIGDHFAKPGSNDRVWNSHEKLAQRAPDVFVAYCSADAINLGCEAWLGPHYQISAQVNRVNPGGTAQSPHRDYHVGFYEPDQMDRFPRHVHLMSQALTLQGAVAHTDMPLESGPTMLLPFSQLCHAGFIAALRPDFREVFHEFKVQLPLTKGDVVFFNPALMHGAGANTTTDFHRINNLLQVSSAFGRTMETMNTDLTTLAAYPYLLEIDDERTSENVIAAAAEGYAFPTNLDYDPPLAGLAPASPADTLRTAIAERWPIERLQKELEGHKSRRRGLEG